MTHITPITSMHEDIHAHCHQCTDTTHLTVDVLSFELFKRGSLVQKCFPTLTADEREVVIAQRTGHYLCATCWDSVFDDGEDADG